MAKGKQHWLAIEFHVASRLEPVLAEPVDFAHGMGDSVSGCNAFGLHERWNRLILVADDELHLQAFALLQQSGRIAMQNGVVAVVRQSVPVDNDAINARELHQQQVVLQHMRIARVVRPNEWVIL